MLDISADIVNLTAALVDIPSESRQEQRIADAVESALRQLDHVQVTRFENSVVARTELGRDERVVIAGHLDTVPAADNLPHRIDGDRLYGLGSNDMKGGVAVGLRCAHEIREPRRDVTYVFYECEEIDDEANGLRRLVEAHPDLLSADFAVLMEPSDAGVEAGCQGTLRAHIRTSGERAHSARSWLGRNAIHAAGDILHRLEQYAPRTPTIDGLTYREGMNAVGIEGGVATNVIPDACVVTVNYRYAPDRSPEEAEAYMREFFDGYPLEIVDNAQGALRRRRFWRPPGRCPGRSSAGLTCPASRLSACRR